jgi:predicted lipoprotein
MHKRIYKIYMIVAVSLLISLMISCGKNGEDPKSDFDRKSMLQNLANNLIQPAFKDLQQKVDILKANCDNFVAATNEANLLSLQIAWDDAYSSWMYANAYNVGPAGEEGIRKTLVEEIGTWPANITTIENNILSNNVSLNDFYRDNRGFNAIEYLIFDSNSSPNKITVAFSTSENRKNYLSAIVAKLKGQVDAVVKGWESGYATNFIMNDGTSVGSSTALFYNEFVRSYESIKNFKVGVPLGKRAGQISTDPTKVEARFSGKSLKYLKLHILAIDDIWNGRTKSGEDGIGWKEYLDQVTGGKELIVQTEAQMEVLKSSLNNIPDTPSFEEQINSNFQALAQLHTELQKHTRNYKSDMSSLLGIAITFSSGDGD